MMIALLCIMAQYARADKWDGITYEEPTLEWRRYYISSPEFMDDGVATSRMMKSLIIHNAAQMAYVRKNFCHEVTVASETVDISSVILCLEADIDMGDWEPLGAYDYYGTTSSTPFTGTFYGNGHTIRINIKDAEANYQGLFLRIGENGTVRDLHVAGNIQCSDSRLVGGIAGENDGTINNCWVSADVSSDWQSSSSAFDAKVGGIAGENSGTISYCCVTGNVKNNDSDVGGIVGCNNKSGVVDNCTFYGTRSSTHAQDNEYIGDYSGTMTNMHNSFTDSELAEYINIVNDQKLLEYFNRFGYHPGWFLRFLYCDAVQHPFTVTVNNESEGSLAADVATARPGQSVKLTPSAGNSIVKITVRDADKNLQNEWFSPLAESLSFDMPRRDVTVTTTNTTWTGSGTADDPYLIPTTEAWERIHTTLMSSATENAFENTYFKQTADIDITGNANTKKFCGIYDGNNHRINCKLTNPVSGSTEAVAPFHNTNSATIKNLYVTGSISGGIHSAGLIAFTHGNITIDNCRVAADITCTGNNYNDAHGSGFVGHADDSNVKITNSLFDGKLIATSNGKGDIRLGAFVGWAGNNVDIQYSAENGAYKGTTGNSQTALYWKDANNNTPDNSHLNIYVSDLGHHEGADKVVKVSSGTDEMELSFPESCYHWQEVYHGAMFKSLDEYAIAYLIHGKFYTINGSVMQFDVTYPENWKDVKVFNGEKEISKSSGTGHYSFKLQSDADIVITATYAIQTWTDEGNYATEFSTVDNKNKTVTITTPAELARLAKLVYDGTDSGKDWTYNLDADLDMSKYDWTPIGNGLTARFLGTFDGQGHTISGINVVGTTQYAGLFGVVNGTVKNLRLTKSTIQGKRYVGGIAGQARFDLLNCYVGSDVTVKAVAVDNDDESGQDCGGVVGYVQNQGSNNNYSATDAWIRGCYSAATVSGMKNVGGIAGHLASGTVHYCVSQANATTTGTDGTVAYVIGNKTGGTVQHNFYIADTESGNTTDVRAYHVSLSDGLKQAGFAIYTDTNENFDCSDLHFSRGQYESTEYVNQLKVGDEWYGPQTYTIGGSQYIQGHDVVFFFTVTKKAEECQVAVLEDVKVNGETPKTTSSGVYYYGITGDAVITGTPAVTLYDDSNFNHQDKSKKNDFLLSYNNNQTGNVTISGRTLYKDGSWNTLCLPFDVTISGSVLDGADVRTLVSSSFDSTTGTLTLNFSPSKLTKIEAGKPYIIKWANGDNLVDPKFENVTISYDQEKDPIIIGTENVDPVVFCGNYLQIVYPKYEEGYKDMLYLGAANKLYYPDGTADPFYFNCFRAGFMLQNGLTVGELAQGAKSIVLNFGDDETTTSIHNSQFTITTPPLGGWGAYYSLDGHRINGKPTTKGIYIHNGKKIVIK